MSHILIKALAIPELVNSLYALVPEEKVKLDFLITYKAYRDSTDVKAIELRQLLRRLCEGEWSKSEDLDDVYLCYRSLLYRSPTVVNFLKDKFAVIRKTRRKKRSHCQ
eukprot:TRINITY_DN7073_c0_g1_i1.p1 TRINITY_DN7073_c0_g1~~TRINITY_DN7073_c0_g1_i1.p1  ORF type:complete len:108 (-),score=13.43 TRINITY_DN7073_c0_g1_i1:23-346(-)